jgi:hypothetical protein
MYRNLFELITKHDNSLDSQEFMGTRQNPWEITRGHQKEVEQVRAPWKLLDKSLEPTRTHKH